MTIFTKPITIGGGKVVIKVQVFPLFNLGEWAESVQTARAFLFYFRLLLSCNSEI